MFLIDRCPSEILCNTKIYRRVPRSPLRRLLLRTFRLRQRRKFPHLRRPRLVVPRIQPTTLTQTIRLTGGRSEEPNNSFSDPRLRAVSPRRTEQKTSTILFGRGPGQHEDQPYQPPLPSSPPPDIDVADVVTGPSKIIKQKAHLENEVSRIIF
jgi:hypothetical protein